MKVMQNNQLFFILVLICFLKILFYFIVKMDLVVISLGGGSDADYYHGYAVGEFDFAVNIWPIILRWLNQYGVYNRDIISFILLIINVFVIPYLLVKNIGFSFKRQQNLYLMAFFVALVYPSLYFFTFDIYRDVFMVLSFLFGVFLVKYWINISNIFMFFLVFIFLLIYSFFLIGMRPYLGYAFLVSMFFWKLKLTKKRLILLGILYLGILFFANYIGALNRLTEYRSGFVDIDAGSTLGLDFSNPLMFIPNFVLSIIGQLFGLYITNSKAILLFLIETVPFFYMLYFVLKNISYADKFIRFLLIFFVIYGSIWLISNDNLGTAIRLRMYNYFVIYICFFYILSLIEDSKRRCMK